MLHKFLYFKQRLKNGKKDFYCTKKQILIELYSCTNKKYNKTDVNPI